MNVPLPQKFLERLGRLGEDVKQGILDATWDGSRFLLAPKTIVVRALFQEVYNELEEHAFSPSVIEKDDVWGWVIEVNPSGKSLNTLLSYRAGLVYSQEYSSFRAMRAACSALELTSAATVLDACAAPGGKSLFLNQLGGQLVVNEPVVKRRASLIENLRRCGASPETTVTGFDFKWPKEWNEVFDALLIDAPCSGGGLLRKADEHGLKFWNEKLVSSSTATQRHLLKTLAPAVKPGGFLMYSTCTFELEENEEQVAAFLSAYSDFVPVTISLEGMSRDFFGGYHAYPRRDLPGEGLYFILLKKAGSGGRVVRPKPGRPLWPAPPPEFRDWDVAALHPALLDADFEKISVPPTLGGLRDQLACGVEKCGRKRAWLWRDKVLAVEISLARGKSRLIKHPLWP